MEKMNRINENVHFVTRFFHSLPHLNMWFVKSNSTFDPNNSDYLEVNSNYLIDLKLNDKACLNKCLILKSINFEICLNCLTFSLQ